MGAFCDFKLEVDKTAYPDATSQFSVSEILFDDGTARNVTPVKVSDNHMRYRFDDYGEYHISISCNYGGREIVYEYMYRHLYRPTVQVDPHYGDQRPHRKLRTAPTARAQDDTIRRAAYETEIILGGNKEQPLPERVYCALLEQYHEITHDLTRRLEYRTLTTGKEMLKLPAGSSSSITLPKRYSMLDPKYDNYTDHYRVLYPYGNVTYPDDFCGLLE